MNDNDKSVQNHVVKESFSLLKYLFKEAFNMEFTTQGGRYNVVFTMIIVAIITICIILQYAYSNIYMCLFKEKVSILPIYILIGIIIFWGLACFLYMVFIADNKKRVNKKISNSIT